MRLTWEKESRREMEAEKVEGQIVAEADVAKQGRKEEAAIGRGESSWVKSSFRRQSRSQEL